MRSPTGFRLWFFRYLRGVSHESLRQGNALSEPWFVESPKRHASLGLRLCAI